MIDDRALAEYSSKYKIDKFTVLREYLQIVFMNQLYVSLQRGDLVFKGGTAIRLMYGSARFSEDLDFNCGLKKTEAEGLIKNAVEVIKKKTPGVYFKELKTLQGYSAKIYLNTEISPMPLTVKLDFSFRERSLDVVQKTIPSELPVSSYSLVAVMSEAEILAEKVRTVFQRKKGRDLYDIWYLLNKKVDVNIKLIEAKMKLLDRKFSQEELVKEVAKFNQNDLARDLFKFLPFNQRGVVNQLKELVADQVMGIDG